MLILTGHFGNWEVATVAGIAQFPADARPVPLRAPRDQAALARRARDAALRRSAGFGVVGKRGSLDAMLERLARGDAIVFPFDQHAQPPDGIDVEFFGHAGVDVQEPRDHRARHRRAGGAGDELARARRPPRAALRGADRRRSSDENTNEAIRRTTRAYNAALERLVLRHPEQWYWVHRRWKTSRARGAGASCEQLAA